MNIERWNKVYKTNIELDSIYEKKYGNDSRIFDQNCIELMVEIGEFLNETKEFKYWLNKLPDKAKELEEYADVIIMILYFYKEYDLEIKKLNFNLDEKDTINLIKILYDKAYNFLKTNDKEILQELFFYTLYIGKILKFKEEELLDEIENKQKKNIKRFDTGYFK